MFLDRIVRKKREEIAEKSAKIPQSALERLAAQTAPARDLLAALRQPGLGVIAEIKRASPSRGPIRPDLDAAALALQYEEGGAAAISVLTDEPHFGARPGDLEAVRTAVSVPVLRKDFILSEYQLWESRAMGADAVLLIVAALETELLPRLIDLAMKLGICPLVEVHTADEVDVAVACGAQAIGINNRDLATFRVELETTRRLRPLIPPGPAVVSESGIVSPRDAALVGQWGVDAVLVGEALVASQDPAGFLRSLRASASGFPARGEA